jgi:hypothetical protein
MGVELMGVELMSRLTGVGLLLPNKGLVHSLERDSLSLGSINLLWMPE